MFRPERMSRVSVTGSKQVLDDVVDTVHDLGLVHLSDYDGSWEGFEPGDPMEGGDEASEKLVTVRSLQSILGVEEDDAGPSRLVTDDALEDELADVRQEVNDLDDRRNELQDQLRAVEERIDVMEPFVRLGIDLDLLGGYEELSVAVGEGDADDVRAAIEDAGIDTYELFVEESVVAAFVRTDREALEDALVGATFTQLEVPDVTDDELVDDGAVDPEEYRSKLQHRKQQLENKLDTVENELEDLRLDVAGFLLAAEEKLAIEAEKTSAPLSFATTENAFVAEGWIPTDRFGDLESALTEAVGDHVEIEELERADYDDEGHVTDHEEVEPEASAAATSAGADVESEPTASADEEPTAADADEERPVADGGVVTAGSDEPPVIMNNPGFTDPFELLVETVERPRYGEFDPTVLLWLTFPAFYGFMIGDLGYGILYTLLGYGLWSRFESDAIRSLGGIAMWAGGFTMLFGVLYGELFGLHVLGDLYGGPAIKKGISPATVKYAQAWLVVATMVGLGHMTIGYALDFAKNLSHGVKDAFFESGSWALLFVGLWVWIFSTAAAEAKPEFVFKVLNGQPLPFGFAGFSPGVGLAGLGVAAVGLFGVAAGEILHEGAAGVIIAFLEGLVGALANVLSYTRLAAVLLAKAGMALVVNLIFFGAFVTGEGSHAEFHYALGKMPEVGTMYHGQEVTSIMFPGLMHGGIAALVGGLVVLVVGHALVLALGVTSAGLQAVRLEYVEFMTKFYEGGGEAYDPFGYVREFTTDD